MEQGPVFHIGPTADAIRAAGKELCDLIAVMTANHCCEKVQLLVVKKFSEMCEVKNTHFRNCNFDFREGVADEPPLPTQVDHGTGNY